MGLRSGSGSGFGHGYGQRLGSGFGSGSGSGSGSRPVELRGEVFLTRILSQSMVIFKHLEDPVCRSLSRIGEDSN